MKKIYTIIIAFIACLTLSLANATEFTEKDIKNFITNMGSESQKILNNKKLSNKQTEEEYKIFSNNIVDSEWVARFILGNNWRDLNSEQQKEFETLYKQYLLSNYMPKLKDYNTNLKIIKVTKQKDTVYMADTITKDKNNRDVNVTFRLGIRNDRIYITDIIPEGISFIGNQRSDIGYTISQIGYDKFIEQLKVKINENNK